jgi:hypothetical protein
MSPFISRLAISTHIPGRAWDSNRLIKNIHSQLVTFVAGRSFGDPLFHLYCPEFA